MGIRGHAFDSDPASIAIAHARLTAEPWINERVEEVA